MHTIALLLAVFTIHLWIVYNLLWLLFFANVFFQFLKEQVKIRFILVPIFVWFLFPTICVLRNISFIHVTK